MAVMPFNNTPPQSPNTRQGTIRQPFAAFGNPVNDRPKAKIWLNIGYEANGKFINVPVGLPIDTMEPAEARGQNADWVKQRAAQNDLLDALKRMGMELQPGQEQTINLEVRMRRVNEELVVEKAENEYAVDFTKLFAPPQTMQAAE